VLHLADVAHVEPDHHRAAAGRFDPRARFLHRRDGAAGQVDARAGRPEVLGDGSSDPAGGPGDDARPALERTRHVHESSPFGLRPCQPREMESPRLRKTAGDVHDRRATARGPAGGWQRRGAGRRVWRMLKTQNIRVARVEQLTAPEALRAELAAGDADYAVVLRARETIRSILRGADGRLLAVVGPCSIHDPEAAIDYARRLAGLARQVEDTLFVVMRVYFEKPRTT